MKALKGFRNMNFTFLSNLFNRTTYNIGKGGTLNQFIFTDKETMKQVIVSALQPSCTVEVEEFIETQEPEHPEQ